MLLLCASTDMLCSDASRLPPPPPSALLLSLFTGLPSSRPLPPRPPPLLPISSFLLLCQPLLLSPSLPSSPPLPPFTAGTISSVFLPLARQVPPAVYRWHDKFILAGPCTKSEAGTVKDKKQRSLGSWAARRRQDLPRAEPRHSHATETSHDRYHQFRTDRRTTLPRSARTCPRRP